MQLSDFDCGRAAVEAVLQFYSLPDRVPVRPDPVNGMSPDVVEAVLRSAGLRVLSGSLTLPDLAHLTATGRPVLCLTQLDGVGHWVVAAGVTSRRVRFHCPARGPASRTLGEWRRLWWDTARNGVRLDAHGVCGWPAR
jgi:hypothetical protein